MNRILYLLMDASISAAILIPVFCCLNKSYIHSIRKSAGYLIFAVYLSAIFAVAGLPDICYIRFHPHFNFRPFAYMLSDLTNTLLNVLLFLPLGVFLPCLWEKYFRFVPTVLFGLLTSFSVEFLQIFTYRASDINDLMTNTLGTILGWIVGRMLLYMVPSWKPSPHCKEVYLITGITFFVMYFLHPFLATWVWNGIF